MKNEVKKLLAALSILLFLQVASAQNTHQKDSFDVTGSKWIVCADMALIANYKCTDPYTAFEFYENGRYKEYPKHPIDPKKEFLEGSWSLVGDKFTIDQDDTDALKEFPKTYTLVWADKNTFYGLATKEGQLGPDVYVYFRRLPKNGMK